MTLGRRAFLGGVLALGCVAVFASCGRNADSAATDGAVTDGGDEGLCTGCDVVPGFNADGGDANLLPSNGCSADLQNVINGSGTLVKTCPPDQGCAAGECVAACDAAAASKGSVGCDFIVSTPSFERSTPPCFAAFLANNWGKAVKISVSRGGQTYDVTKFGRIPMAGQPESSWPSVPSSGVPVGQVAVLFLSSDPGSPFGGAALACPVPAALEVVDGGVDIGSIAQGTARGQAWHIQVDAPISAYDISPYGGAKTLLPSAELLLPTTAWGKNYYGIVPTRATMPLETANSVQWAQVTASVDGTTVTIVPSVTLPSAPDVAMAMQNQVATYTLKAGEYIQWQDTGEMSSSIISADQPIAFSSGNVDCYISATSTGGGCDIAHQQIPPIAAFGFEYIAPPFATRMKSGEPESIPYRIVGAVAGTTLTYDPALPSGPATLAAGQVVDFESTVAFRVTSQDKDHPFYVGQLMSGCKVTGGSIDPGGCLGDEEFVNILPPAQYLSKYIFFTDSTYPTTNLVFVREKPASPSAAFADVTLDCVGTVGGWKPIGTSGKYEITNVDLIRGGKGNGTCTNGPHTAKSDSPFGLMVWGLAEYASYAYPAGGNVVPINTVVIPPLPK